MNIKIVSKEEFDFASETQESKEIIKSLEQLDESDGGVMVDFDSYNQKVRVESRVRNYFEQNSLGFKKVDYGNKDSLKYLIYFKKHVAHRR